MRSKIATLLNSISVKVLLAFVVGMILSVSFLALLLIVMLALQKNIFSESDVSEYALDIAEALQFDDRGVPVDIQDNNNPMWIYETINEEVAYRVLDVQGNVVLYSSTDTEFWPSTVDFPYDLEPFIFEYKGMQMDAATKSVEYNGHRWFVQVAVSRRFMYFAHHTFALRFIEDGLSLLSLVLFFVFGACAHFTLRHTLKPLRQLSDAAMLISPRSLQARLKNDNVPVEIAPLVNSFNHVLERIEQGYRVQQDFLSTAAHELKTPLALIRAQLELMPESEEQHWLLHDVSYMSRQVQQLLLLAETSEPHNYNFSMVDIKSMAEEVGAYLQRRAEMAKVSIVIEDRSNREQWHADKGAIFTLLKNMLENAIQHAPPDSDVYICVNTHTITIRDWGPGVTEDQLALLFTRFWRGEHRRDLGAGLGLSICNEIALTHGWKLSALRMDPGLLLQISAEKKTPS